MSAEFKNESLNKMQWFSSEEGQAYLEEEKALPPGQQQQKQQQQQSCGWRMIELSGNTSRLTYG